MSCIIYPRNNIVIPAHIHQLLDYSAPMVNHIKIEFEWQYTKSDQPFIFSLSNGWILLDEILSGPKYPSLKTLHLTFSSLSPTAAAAAAAAATSTTTTTTIRSSEMKDSVGKFLKEKLPRVSSCGSHIETEVISRSS